MIKYKIFLLLLITAFIGCQQEQSTNEQDEIATVRCKCMRPLADMNKKVQKLMHQDKMEEVQALFGQLESLSQEADKCTSMLEVKYGVLSEERLQKASGAMKKLCPDIVELLERNKALEKR